MNTAQLSLLPVADREMVLLTTPAALAEMSEDEVLALHTRVRRARNKYQGLYRRGAAARVKGVGARGEARPRNLGARDRAEVMNEALARVARRLAALAKAEQQMLRAERLAEAAGAKGRNPKAKARADRTTPAPRRPRRTVAAKRTGDRSLRSPAAAKSRAATRATGARRQAKRDAR